MAAAASFRPSRRTARPALWLFSNFGQARKCSFSFVAFLQEICWQHMARTSFALAVIHVKFQAYAGSLPRELLDYLISSAVRTKLIPLSPSSASALRCPEDTSATVGGEFSAAAGEPSSSDSASASPSSLVGGSRCFYGSAKTESTRFFPASLDPSELNASAMMLAGNVNVQQLVKPDESGAGLVKIQEISLVLYLLLNIAWFYCWHQPQQQPLHFC